MCFISVSNVHEPSLTRRISRKCPWNIVFFWFPCLRTKLVYLCKHLFWFKSKWSCNHFFAHCKLHVYKADVIFKIFLRLFINIYLIQSNTDPYRYISQSFRFPFKSIALLYYLHHNTNDISLDFVLKMLKEVIILKLVVLHVM